LKKIIKIIKTTKKMDEKPIIYLYSIVEDEAVSVLFNSIFALPI